MKKTILTVALAALMILVSSCGMGEPAPSPTSTMMRVALSPLPSETPSTLPTAEVTQYEGKDLSSINDVYDNAIVADTPQIDPDTYRLEINGLVEKPLSLTYDEVLGRNRYEQVVKLVCVDGWDAEILWEGVLLKDVLAEAAPTGEANTIIFHCADGYTTTLPLDWVQDNDILLASKMNGLVIPPEKGYPFMVVARQKYGYKWAKWITGMELGSDPEYRGYWESRGYDIPAVLPIG